MAKQITCNRIGFKVCGTAPLGLWGGGHGSITMKPVTIHTDRELTEDQIKSCINDNGFGCETIFGAHIFVYELYETPNGIVFMEQPAVVDEYYTVLALNGVLTKEKLKKEIDLFEDDYLE